MKQLFLIIIGLASITASLPQPAFAVSEADYANQMKELVWPAFNQGIEGSFKGVAGLTIRYRKWENPNEAGAIVLLPGRSDPYMIHAETIYDLLQAGYSVYAIDHRGQGTSDRMLADSEIGYVLNFDDYVTDLKTFVDTVVNAKPHAKRFVLAHSMGGTIAALYFEKYPNDFTAGALLASMFKINTAPYTMCEAGLLSWWLNLIGDGPKYAPTQGPFDPNRPFENNTLTRSQVRFENHQTVNIANPLLIVAGASVRWTGEGLKAGQQIHDSAAKIATPFLLLSAGNDQIVDTPEELYVCEHAQRCTSIPTYPDSRHDILSETDAVRDDAVAQILKYYSEH